jgi:hypothetical protein
MSPLMEQHGFLDDEERRPRTARERRIALAREKEHVRLALSSIAPHGYYVFDEIITENAGLLDYLVVGALGVVVIIVRYDEGCVGFGRDENEILLDGKPFVDDPFSQAAELVEELSANLLGGDVEITGIVCFPRADFEVDENRKPPLGTTPVWELPWALDPEGEEETLTPADVEEIAEKVQKIYGRPPIVMPQREER